MGHWSSWLMFHFCLTLLLSQSLIHSSFSLFHPFESTALIKFKNSFFINSDVFKDQPYPIITNPKTPSWKNGTDCCSWDGVLCDKISGHVIGLDLSNSGLQGPLHSNNTLFSLRHLQTLILDYNDFSRSQIPPEFGSFTNLRKLSLQDANFSGNVPIEMSHLTKLSHLSLSSTDYFTTFSWQKTFVYLEAYVFKRMLQNFTNLNELILHNINMADVELLNSFKNVSSSLRLLHLSLCNLQGNLPENVFRLPNLEHLSLSSNYDLIGSMPTFNWSSPLRYLDLSETRIPIDLPYLSTSVKSLQSLFLSNCSFKGSSYSPAMFTNFSQLVQLSFLDLSLNNFGGQIPLLSLNLQQFIMLDLSGNKFIGKIPEFLKSNSTQGPQPEALEVLNLGDNSLTGSIPSWIHSLEFLVILRLEDNKLTGTIKEFNSKSLLDLSLSSNNLSGEIPNSIFKQEDLQLLDLSYNNLNGVVELSKFSSFKNLGHLKLSFNNFTVHSNKISNHNPFPQLEYLSLASCNIRSLPHILKSMKSLDRLEVSHNQIHGRIPKWLCDYRSSSLSKLNISHNLLTHVERVPCKNLQSLDLRSNMIQGHLPIVPPSLVVLFISNNNLFGEIPSTYCNLSELKIFDISNNSIEGKIPSCLANKFSLSVLDLHMNSFSGKIPQDMFKNLTSLRSLHLSGNHLDGFLPRSLRNCKSLEVLDVGNNMIYDTFPRWLEELPMLQVLVLKSNKFHGSIGEPKVKNSFQKLQIMDLSNNEFTGLLPTKYFESFTSMMDGHVTRFLTHIGENYYQDSVNLVVKGHELVLEKIISIFITIDFSKNNFEGEIPKSIGQLKSLKGLNFSQNRLEGYIPASLVNLSNLEWLDLSLNKLIGEIPSKMMDLTQLSFLNLSHNKLVGPIPRGNQFDTFDVDSYSGNLELCGPPISKSCNDGMQQDGDHGDKHTDHITLEWKIVMMGYGCGLVVGISVGYMVLYSERFDYWLYKKVGELQRQRPRRQTNTRSRMMS